MGTTTLRSLEDKLMGAIGDKNGTYAHNYYNAIVNAIREIYPKLHRPVEDTSLTTDTTINRYELPTDFQNGDVLRVEIQISGDDADTASWQTAYNWSVFSDGTDKYLELSTYIGDKMIRLIGYCPLEIPTKDTETISLDGEKVNLLIAYAAYLLYEMEIGIPSAEDASKLERASAYWWAKYQRLLPTHKMGAPSPTMRIAPW